MPASRLDSDPEPVRTNASSPSSSSSPAVPDAGYSAEIRFGIVMYGGVSLAIYINGVTNEMFEMACATPRDGYKLDETGATATREIYRRLSWLAGEPTLREEYARLIKNARSAMTSPQGNSADSPDSVLSEDCWPNLD